jgi:threonine synthase
MGCPIDTLVLATNENNVLDEFFRTGIYRPRSSANTFETSSPSMDISKASNFERFVFDVVDRDPQRLAALWQQLDTQGYFDLSHTPEFKAIRPRFGIVSCSSNHADRLATIQAVYQNHQVLIDTHTADGVKVAREQSAPQVAMVVLETALPVKFAATIVEAVGIDPPLTAQQQAMMQLPQRVVTLPAHTDAVKKCIVQVNGA